jgi:hypothetical protein
MIIVTRVVELPYPVQAVTAVLGDPVEGLRRNPHVKYFREAGEGAHLRGRYHAVERLGPLKMALEYRIERSEPGRAIVLRGRNRYLEQVDVLIMRQTDEGTTRITRHLQVRPRGPGILLKRWFGPQFEQFVQDGTRQLARSLETELARRTRPVRRRGPVAASRPVGGELVRSFLRR